MTTKELIDYIKKELERGEQKDVVKARLLQNSWSSNDIEETFRLVESKIVETENIPASAPTHTVSSPTSTSFWDFVHKKIYRSRREKIYDFIFGFLGIGFVLDWLLQWFFGFFIHSDYLIFLPSLLISIFFLFLGRKYVTIGFFSMILLLLFLAYLFLLFRTHSKFMLILA